ncbi:hypothetical protein Gotri_007272 [Gossypium trilobum]|uniref:DUF4283 domain-containing protein n=1 Tax=Gossypium trilobum TaxID=34281 RepID=A0A7J9EFJ7_9ROSI|nr:hypothetical protein [Gossypium trilobum]
MADVEGNFVDLSLEDDEEVVVQLASERLDLGASFENCFVGSFLTSSVVNFQSMRATLANVWHPIGGISISDLNKGIFLFRLYHKMDMDRIKASGVLLEYDVKVVSLGYKGIMRVRVRFNIQKPLKRKKKIVLPNGTQTYVSFACEKLTLFCFVCGILRHGESFCPVRILQEKQDFILGWDISLRAPTR